MSTRNQVALGVVALVLVALLTFLYGRDNASRANNINITPEVIVVEQDTLYVYLDQDQTIDRADVIFLGKVVNISPTHWNQDNGQEWSGGLLIHTIDLEVLRPLVPGVDKSDVMTVTVLGESPLTGTADHDLAIGDQAIFFVRHKALAWREGGLRPIEQLVGDPMNAYYRQRSDGLFSRPGESEPVSLQQITAQLAQRRAVVPEADN